MKLNNETVLKKTPILKLQCLKTSKESENWYEQGLVNL